MTIFQNPFWGYELNYPEQWTCESNQEFDVFSPIQEQDTAEPLPLEGESGQVLVRGEWNWARQPIGPLWNRHIGSVAGMLGAKEVGSAPWRLGDAVGLEAEIVLPKKDQRRLWTGVLMHNFIVLHFMATHPKEARAQFEPVATGIIKSLRFPERIMGLETTPEGLPIPPGYTPTDPISILSDIPDSKQWRAYTGAAGVGALQAFFLRELPAHKWLMEEYVPFPGPTDLGFARLQLRKSQLSITLGIMPKKMNNTDTGFTPARIVFKLNTV